MQITIPSSGGLHTKTQFNEIGQLTLLPTLQLAPFLGDTAWWNRNGGDTWTENKDVMSVTQTGSNEDNLELTFNLNQTVASPINFRVKASGNNSGGGTYGVDVFDGVGQFDILVPFPVGEFEEIQVVNRIVPTTPVTWLYIKIKAYDVEGNISVWDGELWTDDTATTEVWGKWISDSIDYYELKNNPITSGTWKPKSAVYYYGAPDNVDNSGIYDHCVTKLSGFDQAIVQSASKNTARQQQILQDVMANDTEVYTYCAVATSASVADIETEIQACATGGYTGIFLDQAGYDNNGTLTVTRDIQNQIIDYAHSLNLKIILNGFPWEVLDNKVDSTYNPNGTTIHLNTNDMCLIESFYYGSDGTYEGSTNGFSTVYPNLLKAQQLSASTGIGVAVLSYDPTNDPIETEDQTNAYLLCAGFGFASFAYGGANGGTNIIDYESIPDVPVGNALVSPFAFDSTVEGGNKYKAIMDNGVIWFTAVDSPISRSAGTYDTTAVIFGTVSDVPEISVPNGTGVVTTIQTSKDGVNWRTITSSQIVDRFVQCIIELNNFSS